MRRIRTLAFSIAGLGLALPSGASAGTLWTPSLAPEGTSRLRCDIQNVGTEPFDVSIDVLDYDGTVVASGDTSAPPGGSAAWSAPAEENPRSCRFRFRGSRRKARASACVYQSDVGCIAAVSAQ
jgi:hypothetical protein